MDVVLGDLPLAGALAAALPGPVLVASAASVPGPWLWRRADVATGEGLADVVAGARRCFLLRPHGARIDGAVAALARAGGRPTVAIVARGAQAPPGVGRVEIGVPWGPEHPLHRAWSARIASGRHLFVADLGPIRVTRVDDAVAAGLDAMAALERGEVIDRSVRGVPTTIDGLVAAIAAQLRRPARTTRLGWRLACWQAGVAPHPLRASLTSDD